VTLTCHVIGLWPWPTLKRYSSCSSNLCSFHHGRQVVADVLLVSESPEQCPDIFIRDQSIAIYVEGVESLSQIVLGVSTTQLRRYRRHELVERYHASAWSHKQGGIWGNNQWGRLHRERGAETRLRRRCIPLCPQLGLGMKPLSCSGVKGLRPRKLKHVCLLQGKLKGFLTLKLFYF